MEPRARQSWIRYITREVSRVGGVNLGQGSNFLASPRRAREDAAEAILAGRNNYSLPEGIPELRQAWAEKLRVHNNVRVDPETELLVTAGATGAYVAACATWFEPGSELIFLEPFYPYHVTIAKTLGLVPRFVRLDGPGWHLSRTALSRAVGPKTRGLVLCNPVNPTGKVYRMEELSALADLCKEHDLRVVSDEVYEFLTFERPHYSIAAIDGMASRAVTVSSLSKLVSTTGWRVGFACGPTEEIQRMREVCDRFYICAPTPLQYGLVSTVRDVKAIAERLRRRLRQHRDYLSAALEGCGFEVLPCDGTYYLMARHPRRATWSDEDAMRRLLTAGVGAVPGSEFNSSHRTTGLLRFSFAVGLGVLRDAIDRITRGRPWNSASPRGKRGMISTNLRDP
jgi:aminotransferase